MNSLLVTITLGIIAAMALVYAVSGSIALLRTTAINAKQKWLQSVFVWALPFLGPLLVMHLLADRDPDSIPAAWSGSKEVNSYVWQALTGHARLAYKSATVYVETQIIESVSDALSDTGTGQTGTDAAGDGD